MKRFLISVLAVTAAVCSAFGLAGCFETQSDDSDDKKNDSGHTHEYSAEWASDKDYHWHECTADGCDQKKKDEAAHADNDKNGVCDVCLYVINETLHTHALKLVEKKAATCTADGNSAYYTCSGCNKWFYDADGKNEIKNKANVVIAKGHKLTHIPAKTATCTAEGNSEFYICALCNKCFSDAAGKNEISKSSVIIPKAHNLTHVAAKAATCTADGNSAYYVCSGCSKTFSDAAGKNEISKSSVIIPKAHNLTHVAAKAATCTADGNSAYYTCGGCNKWFTDAEGKNEITDKNSVILKSAGHVWSGNICSVCGESNASGLLTFTDKGSYYEVSKADWDAAVEIVVPETYNSKPVTSVKESAFRACKFTSVTIPDSVTFIGDRAFTGCTTLKTLVLSQNITCIKEYTFNLCSSLTSINISAKVTSIETCAFRDCSSLKDINFGGTKAQWNAIAKADGWNMNTGNYTVHCTDGNIGK